MTTSRWTLSSVVFLLSINVGLGQPVTAPRLTPLVLAEQGSFFVGGTTESRDPNSSDKGDARGRFGPGDIAVGHLYVEYQIPNDRRYRHPVIMVHGGGHSGKTYGTTPDGREGWFTTFARRGFAPYVVDAPNRGRAGYDPTTRYKVTLGLAPASSLEVGNTYSAQSAWVAFRFGPQYREQYPGQQFPVDHLDQYVRQLVPSYRDPSQNPLIVRALVALIDRLGPCVLIGHSTGGANVLNAATERPNLVKGVIALEPAGFPRAEAQGALTRVPLVVVQGDHQPETTLTETKAFAQRLAKSGGDAAAFVLPEMGIRGNGHMMMMERNSERIADLLEMWLTEHVADLRTP